MPETTYTNRLRKLLEREGALPVKYRPGNGQRAGMPDLYVAHVDWQGWIEVKYGRNKVRPVQKSVIEMLGDRGVPVVVVRGPGGEVERVDGTVYASLDLSQPLIPQLVQLTQLPCPSPSCTSSSGS